MEDGEGVADFSLLGGPLYRLGCRVGLVRNRTDTVLLGLVLGGVAWVVLLALTLAAGQGQVFFSLEGIGTHVRLLVAIPLLFVCEALVDPRFTAFVRGIVRSQVVPEKARGALASEITRITRWKDAWLPEALFLLAVVLLALTTDRTSAFDHLSDVAERSTPRALGEMSSNTLWYWMVCMPLFRFLLLRWLWRLALWSFFLWRVSRIELRLVPTHPDRAGGLGYLEIVHTEFVPLVAAISAAQSASLAQGLASHTLAFDAIYAGVAFILVADALLFIGPLCVFCHKLWECRVKGLSGYGGLAERYVNEFDRKWLGAEVGQGEQLLGTPDIQSLADLSNSVGIVRDMRLVPVSRRLLTYLGGAALLPLVPLVLFKYPLAELLGKFVGRLAGL